ncbi:unnamed protein product [Lactuca saligna]|uniref:Uncharacterized protein n=1 Tax=Lactuca saligna TaxID=75948 RepID=A0AA36DZX9_LACSI|nr:unnamed protein product [Lactuca saligna]
MALWKFEGLEFEVMKRHHVSLLYSVVDQDMAPLGLKTEHLEKLLEFGSLKGALCSDTSTGQGGLMKANSSQLEVEKKAQAERDKMLKMQVLYSSFQLLV